MAWTNSVVITIDHTKVPNTDQSNFPLLFSGSYVELATIANGGAVTSDSGFDIIFASDSAGTSPLAFERVAYLNRNGSIEAWINIPTLSHTTDTVFYILFGNSAITTDQQAAASVWDANFKAVYHLRKLSGIDISDSTGANNGISGNNGVALPLIINGSFGIGGGSFNGSRSVYLPSMTLSVFSISAWIYPTQSGNTGAFFGGSVTGCMEARQDNSNQLSLVKASQVGLGNSTGTLTVNAWNHVCITYDSSGIARYYIAGAASGTNTNLQTFTTGNYNIGQEPSNGENFIGNIDEVHLSTSVRSDDWIATEFNNQSSPSTFYSSALTETTPFNPYGPYVTAQKSSSPITDADKGANHQTVKPTAQSSVPPSGSTPVPVAVNLKGGITGTLYTEAISVQGGTAPYTFAVTSGSLPTGTSLNASSGVISGTPSTVGSFPFELTVTDATSATGAQMFSISIVAPSGGGGGSFTFIA